MINSIDIRNFRCYQNIHIKNASRLNVIVGDNGVGKTAILESIFLALSTSSEVALRLRQQRGLEGSFTGNAFQIHQALWGDFFHGYDMSQPISVVLSGDSEDNRKLVIAKGDGGSTLPLDSSPTATVSNAPVTFTWTDARGNSRSATPTIGPQGIILQGTGEDLPDFFHFAAGMSANSVENASRFSELSRSGNREEFVKLFLSEYDWIDDLQLEVVGGSPIIFASLRNSNTSIPLPSISSGINRIVAFMIAIAARKNTIITIDEIESGIYYSHHESVWRALISALRLQNGQAFVTTHSLECLEALAKAVDGDATDIRLWRVERGDGVQPSVKQFTGEDMVDGISYGQEIR
jgi:ABC-type transport system involved in cytochrome c biogenesis ATPase subunit